MICQFKYCSNKTTAKKNKFCSHECYINSTRHLVRCNNPECYNLIKNKQKYCSRSCSATINNIQYKKRTANYEGCCLFCGSKFTCSYKRKYCSRECRKHAREDRISNSTLNEYSYTNGSKSSEYSTIRSHARKVYFLHNDVICQCCGYKEHVEVCHITPISEFSKDTKLKFINSLDNLIGLCPNCHWELDNKFNGNIQKLKSVKDGGLSA